MDYTIAAHLRIANLNDLKIQNTTTKHHTCDLKKFQVVQFIVHHVCDAIFS